VNIAKQNISRTQGFTIIELLIVIVVIAILAAISVVAYSNIQDRANVSSAKSDLSTLGKAIDLHHVDASSYPTTRTQLTQAYATYNLTALSESNPDINKRNFIYCSRSNAFAVIAWAPVTKGTGTEHYVYRAGQGISNFIYDENTVAYNGSTTVSSKVCTQVLTTFSYHEWSHNI
jgi:type II secretion system protein G